MQSHERLITMLRLLIVYGSTDGQTAKIARFIADVVRRHGCSADVRDGRFLADDLALGGYDAVLQGASMHPVGFQAYIRDFAAHNHIQLAAMPAAFFAVGLTPAFPTPEQLAAFDAHLANFFDTASWHPAMVARFAGVLAYRRYGFVKRQMMRVIAKRIGAPSDTSRDYEFTDWDVVTRFAEDFVAACSASHTTRSPAGSVHT